MINKTNIFWGVILVFVSFMPIQNDDYEVDRNSIIDTPFCVGVSHLALQDGTIVQTEARPERLELETEGDQSNNVPTRETVERCLIDSGVLHTDWVLRQSILETGWYECIDCSMDVNNLFGFRWKGKYIAFDNWRESVSYYKHWQERWYDGRSYEDFLNCLWHHRDGRCVRYATSPYYTNKLKAIEL